MPFRFEPLPLDGLILIRPQVFPDERGWFMETFRSSDFSRSGLPDRFVQENRSFSRRGVLRGLHYQLPPKAQGKLVTVVRGSVYDVAVDLRTVSETFGRWYARELSEENRESLFVPAGFAHGFLALEEDTILSYRCTAEYDPQLERGIRWDDPDIGVRWPFADPILSEKDALLPTLAVLERAS